MSNENPAKTFPILCQNATKDETATKNFIAQQFNNFFSQFSAFLEQYQKPPQRVGFKKNPSKVIVEVIKNAQTIISKTQESNYKQGMKAGINSVFTALLHPLTPETIRGHSILLFFDLVERLNELTYQVFDDVIFKLVFDFSILKDKIGNDSKFNVDVNSNKRIQIGDNEKTSEDQFYKNIERFIAKFINSTDSKFSLYFSLFQKMILEPVYAKVVGKSEFGISGKAPEILHKYIVIALGKVCERQSAFRLALKNATDYCFEAALQSSKYYIQLKESSYYLVEFFKIICRNSDSLKAEISPTLIIKGLTVLLLFIQHEQKPKYIELTMSYFERWFKNFNQENRIAFAKEITTWENESGLPQALIILLVCFVQLSDDDLPWDLLTIPGNYPSTFLSSIAYFASFYALFISQSLLEYTLTDVSSAVHCLEPQDIWFGKEQYPQMKKFSQKKFNIFFAEEKNEFALCPNVNSLCFLVHEGKNWKPFVNMIKTLKWYEIDDPDLQFRTFLVPASFIYALLKLINYLPPGVKYSIKFINENYIDWIQVCCSIFLSSNKNINPKIIETTFDIIELLISNELCVASFSKDTSVNFILTIQKCMSNSIESIRIKAVKLACSAIYYGIFGAPSILSQDITKSLLETKQNLSDLEISVSSSVELSTQIGNDVKMSYLVKILMEDVYNSKLDNIEQTVNEIISLLQTRANILDVYSLWPIILFTKELSEFNSSTVDKLIIEILNIIEKDDKPINFTEALIQLSSDLIVYSSSKQGIEKFLSLPEKFSRKPLSLFVAKYFNNIAYSDYESNKSEKQFFTNGQQEIIQFYEGTKIAGTISTGHSAYKFNQPQNEEISQLSLPQLNFAESISIPKPEEYSFQSDFNNTLTNMLQGAELFKPTDFNIEQPPLKDIPIFEENFSQKLVPTPSNYGPLAAAFASSTGFVDPVSTYRFVPCGFNTFTADINIPFKKGIDVGLRVSNETQSYKIFESGLGGLDRKANKIIYKDCRNIITFIKNSEAKANKIELVWSLNDASLFLPETSARIKIDEIGNNSFAVRTFFKKELNPPNSLVNAVVSQKSLPAFIIGRILTVSKIIDEVSHSVDVNQEASSALRVIEEENFPQRSGTYASEKALLSVE